MKIVVLDGYTENPGDLSWDGLAQYGELTVYDRSSLTDCQQAIDRIGDAEIVITNKTPITKRVIDACPNIKLISVLATGYNVVDCDYAKQKGIPVTNVPDYGTQAVAQFAIALLLEICSRVGHHDRSVHEGNWQKSKDFCYWDFPLIELWGKTLGIIGFGRIGRATAKIAAAMGMKILACDEVVTEDKENLAQLVDMDTLLAQSDVISLHCPYVPQKGQEIDKAAIEKMKHGAILINTARGQLVEEQALADALNSGRVLAAGLDTVSAEPIRDDNPLLTAKNCIITPHIAWAAKESRQKIMDCAEENVKTFLAGSPINVVNR